MLERVHSLYEKNFARVCNDFTFSYLMRRGDVVSRLTVKINPDDYLHPSLYTDNQFNSTGKLYLRDVYVQVNHDPDGTALRKARQLRVKFDREQDSLDFDLVTFGPGVFQPFDCLIRNNNDNQLIITRQSRKQGLCIDNINERLLLHHLVKRMGTSN